MNSPEGSKTCSCGSPGNVAADRLMPDNSKRVDRCVGFVETTAITEGAKQFKCRSLAESGGKCGRE